MESASVGLILDSSVVIAAERRGRTIREILEQIRGSRGEIEIGVSVITISELMHGAYRADNETNKRRRLAFVDRLCIDVPVHPLTLDIARSIGRIEGEQAARGVALAFEDRAIGATALHLGFEVATRNLRHFRAIPGLTVVEL